MLSDPTRRRVVAAAGGLVTTLAVSPLAMAQSPRGDATKPDKPPSPGKPAGDPGNPAAGKPVSETATAQGGEPKVPGPPPRKTRFALVGLGKLMIEEIIPALRMTERCEVTAVVTGDRDKGRAVAARLGLGDDRVFAYDRIPSLENDDTIDAVYIATPNSIHRRDSVAASRAGKHVLCEKPIATKVEDAEAMIAAARDADRQLMIAYRVHHEPINAQMREWIKQRKYGKPRLISFDTVQDVGPKPQYRLDAERNGGGSLMDIGIYALNTTRWLLQEEPAEVSSFQYSDPQDARFANLEQSIAFQLFFPSGAIANCTSSFGVARVNRYTVMCEKGWLGMEPATSYRGLKGEHGDERGRHRLEEPESVNQFAAEFDHFAQCVQDGTPNATPGEEGLRDLRLMLAIYQSAREGKRIKIASA